MKLSPELCAMQGTLVVNAPPLRHAPFLSQASESWRAVPHFTGQHWHFGLPAVLSLACACRWRSGRGRHTRSSGVIVRAEAQQTERPELPDRLEVGNGEEEDEFFQKTFPRPDQLEKWVDGKKYILVKYSKSPEWVPEEDVGVYRFSLRGYESRNDDGNWVSHAQMPEDTSHLTDAQRERLILELRGQVNFNLSDGTDEDGFRPLPKVPPLERWPYYQMEVSEQLKVSPDELKDFQELDLTEDLPRAFFLANRWKQANEARRHLGYSVNTTLNDVANMNGTVLGFKAMVEQFKRTSKFRRRKPEDPMPSDAERLKSLKITSLLGTKKGSAMALWCYNSRNQKLLVDLCLGDDCMDQGLYAEEVLLRKLISTAVDLGATKLWCRSRRTESGKVFLPPPMRSLGFTAVPVEEQEEEEWEDLSAPVTKAEVSEVIPGLHLWMTTRDLESYMGAANTWCDEMGATDLNEVADNKQELADFLQTEHGMSEDERQRLVQY